MPFSCCCRVVSDFDILVFIEITAHDTVKNIMQEAFVYVACSYVTADIFSFPKECLCNSQIVDSIQKNDRVDGLQRPLLPFFCDG